MRGTPKLSKRDESPYWYITFSQGRRSKRYSTGAVDREQAERVLAQYLLERQKPRLHASDEIRVVDLLDRYAEAKQNVVVGYHLKHLKPYFKDMVLSHICNQTIRAYTAKRLSQKAIRGTAKSERTISPATVRRELDTLGAALGYAKTEGYITELPHIEKPEPSLPRQRWLTYEEAGKLLAAASSNKRLLLFIHVAMNTGARPSSILELKWFQVDLEKRLIHFNPDDRKQTHKHRPTVSINDSLLSALLSQEKKSEYVLGGIKSVKHAFRRACERAKLVGVTPYTLRHTAITWAAREGHSLALIGQMAGHRDPRTTMRYVKHDASFTVNVTGSLSTGALLAHIEAEKIINETKTAKKIGKKQ